jgi:uncharacterized protein (TIGR02996 family)
MDHGEAFYQDILEHPDDRAPRLIYADWLEERGDPRGEFIRLHCAATDLAPGDPARAPLAKRLRELLALHEVTWTDELVGPLRELLGTDQFEYDFRSGFVEALTLPARLFLTHAQALFDLVPLRRLRLLEAGPSLRELARSPVLGRLSGLDLAGGGLLESSRRVSDGFRRLAASPHLAGLRRLGLYNASLGLEHLEQLLDSPHLGRLEALLLGGNSLGDAGAEALADSPLAAGLNTLDLSGTGLTDGGLRALVRVGLRRLSRLNVSGNLGVSNTSLQALAESPHSQSLTLLDLVNTAVTPAGTAALAASPHLAGLTRLFLSRKGSGRAWEALRRRLGEGLVITAHSWHEERLT